MGFQMFCCRLGVTRECGVATGQSVLAWRLGYEEVFSNKPMRGQLGQNKRPLRLAALGHQGFTLQFWVLPSFFS